MVQSSFLDRFSYRVFQFVERHQLIDSGDKILVSVSGGIDSVCLLMLLATFRIKIQFDLHLVHFNHGIREESDEEEDFVRQLAQKKNIPVTVKKSQEFKGLKGMQNKARRWRYDQLNQLLKELNFNKIALGHHLDDLAETQLWRLMRGGSLFSLNPIQIENRPYIRPLLNTSKQELQDYLNKIGQPWREDHSNASNNYTRNHIRHRIIPEMNHCAGGKLAEKLLGINSDACQLKQLFDELIPPKTYQTHEISYQVITNQNPLLGREIIHRYLLFHNQHELTREIIERIHHLVGYGKGNWTVSLKNGAVVRGEKKVLKFSNQTGSNTLDPGNVTTRQERQ